MVDSWTKPQNILPTRNSWIASGTSEPQEIYQYGLSRWVSSHVLDRGRSSQSLSGHMVMRIFGHIDLDQILGLVE